MIAENEENASDMEPKAETPLSIFFARRTIMRAAKVSAVVGTILIAINHSNLLWAGQLPSAWKIVLTYLVPYSVSSYSSAALMRDLRGR